MEIISIFGTKPPAGELLQAIQNNWSEFICMQGSLVQL